MKLYFLWLKRILFSSQSLFQFSSLFSLIGLVLAVCSLTVAVLIINAFSTGLESVLIDRQGHVQVQSDHTFESEESLDWLSDYQEDIKNQVFFLSFEGLIVEGQSFKGALFEAIEDEKIKELAFFKKRLQEGALNKTSPFILIGSELAKQLKVSVGDQLSVVVPQSKEGVFSRRQAQFELAGIMDFGSYEFNSFFVLMPLSSAQKFLFPQSPHQVSGIKLWLWNKDKSTGISQDIAQILGDSYLVTSWKSADPVFFEIIESDKKIIFFVLLILIVSAGFNVSSSLFVQVFRRAKEINLLKAIGIRQSSLRNLFLLNALVLGCLGSSAGLILGLIFCRLLIFLQNQWQLIPIQTYQISEMTWSWRFSDLLFIFFISLLIIVLSAVLPARRAYKMNIKQALSY